MRFNKDIIRTPAPLTALIREVAANEKLRFGQSRKFLCETPTTLAIPSLAMGLYRGHPSRLPFGALRTAALTGPVRDAKKHPSYEGIADSALTISLQREVSTLPDTGTFYFALTAR